MKFCKMCGSKLPDEAVFCTNCGAACEDEMENTTVLDEGLVETELSSADVEETTVLSYEDDEGTTVLEGNIEETTTLEMSPDSDEDEGTTFLTPPEKEKETITSVIPNENGFDKAVNGVVSDVKNHKKGVIVAIIVVALIAVIAITVSVILSNHSSNSVPNSNIEDNYDSQELPTESELDTVVLSDIKTGQHINFSLPMTVEDFSKLDGITIGESLSTKYSPDKEIPYDSMSYPIDVTFNSNHFTVYFKLPSNSECELRSGIINSIYIDKELSNSNEKIAIFNVSLTSTKKQVVSMFGDNYNRTYYSEEDGYDGSYYGYSYSSGGAELSVFFPTDNDDTKAMSISYDKYE